uniref:Uncharacterized protein n=1 Tax=Trypanosoma congolense (strain IL3000) TaxID=1068625 RepID=G0UPN3_TRYCI|nr:conserved hypothetical protein [Trypanosoma congolense IL3000]
MTYPRSLSSKLLFALTVACLFAPAVAFAEEASADSKTTAKSEAENDDITNEDAADGEKIIEPTTRAIFPKKQMDTTPTFHAGSPVDVLIAFRNNDQRVKNTVVLVAASVFPARAYGQALQNFSAIRHARSVKFGETVTFHYTFTPHALLEPNDYNLVVGLYYKKDEDSQPQFIVAFNDTVTIEASLDTDPSTVLTYLTILAAVVGAGYTLVSKLGLLNFFRKKSQPTSERRRVEIGTNGDGYDPDYVSDEHLRYKEAILQRRTSQSPKKKK